MDQVDSELLLIAIREEKDVPAERVFDEITARRAQVWRYSKGQSRSILVTKFFTETILVWMIAGRNYTSSIQNLFACLRIVARKMGLKRIKGIAGSRLAKLYERRAGAKITSYVVEVEV